MKTPMQELINKLVSIKSRIPQELYFEKGMRMGIGSCIKEAKSMLEKEEEVMCEFATAYTAQDQHKTSAKEYYNQTFKTKER